MPAAVPAVLTIAGSDSGGGAGIQADLKAFAACGVHGMSAITAVTAQNTVAVTGVHPVPAAFVIEQVRAVVEDIGVAAVKLGMLGSAETVAAVATALELVGDDVPVVLDPVMVAESGAVLLDEGARAAMIERLLPRATVITPNLPEARMLVATARAGAAEREDAGGAAGRAGEGPRAPAWRDVEPAGPSGGVEAEALARELHALGPGAVVVTGGHRDEATDLVFDGRDVTLVPGVRHPDGAAHGSGCTHASALAAHLALGCSPLESARAARALAGDAVRAGLRHLGAGAGPVDVLGVHPPARLRATRDIIAT